MESSLLRYIWTHTKALQIWISIVILISMPLYFYTLELPKRIINGPIQGGGFEAAGDTQAFLRITLPFFKDAAGDPWVIFNGFEMGRLTFLLWLCLAYAAFIVVSGWLKLYINTYKGKTSERVLRRLRYEMVDRILRFPVWRARHLKPSEISGIIKDEVEPLSDFIGESYSAPLFLGGQALTGLAFLFLQNIYFGLLTLTVVGFQVWLIPRLRRRLLELGAERQKTARAMAGRIGEIVQGIDDVHLNDTSNLVRADLTHRLGSIFFIRLELFKRKFSVKFLNNLLMQFLSFLFYLVGGYLVIQGSLDIGSLVASVAAYKDLPGPVRGLIDWDQQRLMAQQRYVHAIEGFARDDLMADKSQPVEEMTPHIKQGYHLKGVSIDAEGGPALEDISLDLGVREKIAFLSEPSESAYRLLEILARLTSTPKGQVTLDGVDLATLPESLTGRAVGYVDAGSFLPGGTIYDVLVEVLKNYPVGPASKPSPMRVAVAMRDLEIKQSGNSALDFLAEWIDRDRILAPTDSELLKHIRNVTERVGIGQDISEMGLNSRVNPESAKRLDEKIATARQHLRERLAAANLDSMVEPFDAERYNEQATVAENILFGMPVDPSFAPASLSTNPLVMKLLDESGLREALLSLGVEIARTFTEMFADLPEGSTLFDVAAGMSPERVGALGELIVRIDKSGVGEASRRERDDLTTLAMNYAEPRFRFGLVTDEFKEKVLDLRARLRESAEALSPAPVVFHDFEIYNPSISIVDNILFGRIGTNMVGGRDRITNAVSEVIAELELDDVVFEAGLAFNIGSSGRALSEAQRQKLRLARALMKNPDLIILNRALGALPGGEQRAILERLIKSDDDEAKRPGLFCAPINAEHADLFERVVVLKHGRVSEDNSVSGLQPEDREKADAHG